MAWTLLSDFVWEGLSTDTKPTAEQGARDGHIFKELDTGESYIRRAGVMCYINLGLSQIKATKSGLITTDANGNYHVSFTTPFINNQYSVALSTQDSPTKDLGSAHFTNITADGFDIKSRDIKGAVLGGIVVSFVCTRHYNP